MEQPALGRDDVAAHRAERPEEFVLLRGVCHPGTPIHILITVPIRLPIPTASADSAIRSVVKGP